jgi:hypothetical protein
MEIYTASRIRVARQCRRLHHYRYTLGLRGPETDRMRFGTVGHAALEVYYLEWKSGDATDRLPHALALESADGQFDPVDAIKLRVLLRAYDARWGGEDWEVLAVERQFEYELGEYRISGKIDAIIRNRPDGRIYVVEHKTTGSDASVGSAYWERLTLDTQVSIYIDGASMLGYEIAGVIYDVLKRPAHEPKLMTAEPARKYTVGKGCKACGGSAGGKAGVVRGRGVYTVLMEGTTITNPCLACNGTGWKLDADGEPQAPRLHANLRDVDETPAEFEARLIEAIAERPDDFLMRGVVVRLDAELPAMRQDLLDEIALIETGFAPRNADACVRGGEMCAFFQLCVGRADASQFDRGPAHPELSAGTKEVP